MALTGAQRQSRYANRHPERVRSAWQRENHKRRTWLNRQKTLAGSWCLDCGFVGEPECLQYDHRPGEVKVLQVGDGASLKAMAREIVKCDLVCANCHATRTKRRARG